jgi:hypothetical protein
MGCVASAVKKVWSGIKKVAKAVWNGVKKVAKEVYNGVKRVAKAVKEFVKTTIGGIIVTVEVVASLVAGTIIGAVLGSCTLGLLGGMAFFISTFIPTLLIFGSVKSTQSTEVTFNHENEDNEDNNEQIYTNAPNPTKEKPNFDKETEKKPNDQTDKFLNCVNSFISESKQEFNNTKTHYFQFYKNGNVEEVIKQNNDVENDDELDVNNNVKENGMFSKVFFDKSSASLYYLSFENSSFEDTKIIKTIIIKIEEKLKNLLKNNYSLRYQKYDEDGKPKECDLEDIEDFMRLTIVIKEE